MCGIAGFAGKGSRGDLERMVGALSHRGPDDCGFWIDSSKGVHLGHARLSILDLAGGHQPMVSSDERRVIVFNGEIYNFDTLRRELEDAGRVFQTSHSDTEVLLEAYAMWGVEMLGRLNGMWAFALYDRVSGELFLARDRFGKKPLYYYSENGLFAFASELKALRAHPGVPGELDFAALRKYYGYGYIPAPLTIYRGVKKLPSGCWMRITPGGAPEVGEYWSYRIEPDRAGMSGPEEAAEKLGELLRGAVRRRLVADVPVGVFLSGGIDSSTVTALAAREGRVQPVKSFSIGFTEASFDESAYARLATKRLNTDHHEEILSIDAARSILPLIVEKLDEPMGDSSLLPTWLVSRLASRHVKVVLGGDGADELFAGYDPFHAIGLARFYQKIVPRPVHKAISFLAARLPVSHRNMSFDFRLKRTLRGLGYPPSLWCPVWMAPLASEEMEEVFSAPCDPEEVFSEAIAWWDGCASENLIDRVMEFYVRFYLQDDILTKVDRASMMHGLEARSPFLDIEVVEFVRRLPAEWKYHRGRTKYVLKLVSEKLLPREIIERSKKGFGVPIGAWFKSGALALEDTPIPGMNTKAIQHLYRQHKDGRADQRAFLWNTWLFQQWLRHNV